MLNFLFTVSYGGNVSVKQSMFPANYYFCVVWKTYIYTAISDNMFVWLDGRGGVGIGLLITNCRFLYMVVHS